MAKNLYVGNLPWTTTQEQLTELFSQAGSVVSASIVTDKFSGRPRGFAFVEMASDEESEKAIKMFNGYQLGDRAMVVNEARPREERPTRTGGFRPKRDYSQRSNRY